MILYHGFLREDNANRIADLLMCKCDIRKGSSVLFTNIPTDIKVIEFDECYGSSQTLGTSIVEYYHIPLGAKITVSDKEYSLSDVIKICERDLNFNITFEAKNNIFIEKNVGEKISYSSPLEDMIGLKFTISTLKGIDCTKQPII